MSKMMNLIKAKDPTLHKHMVRPPTNWFGTCFLLPVNTFVPVVILHQVKLGIDPTFFGFRWITLMLSQEFLLPGNESVVTGVQS